MSAVLKALRPWEVWDDHNCRGFTTLNQAERFAQRSVAVTGRTLEIWQAEPAHMVAYVRADALGRVWTDVVDCAAL